MTNKGLLHETILIIIIVVVRCKEVKGNKRIKGNILLSWSTEFSSKRPGSQAQQQIECGQNPGESSVGGEHRILEGETKRFESRFTIYQ